MQISEFVLVGYELCSLFSVSSIVFSLVWPMVEQFPKELWTGLPVAYSLVEQGI